MTDIHHDTAVLKPLVAELLQRAAQPRQDQLKKLWADHQAMRPTGKIPVCVYYEGIPSTQWQVILGDNAAPLCRTAIGRHIENDLRQRLWIAANVPDDHIVWPTVTVRPAMARNVDWGVAFGLSGSKNPEDARHFTPVFTDGIDVSRLKFADMEVDAAATAAAIEQAHELVGPGVKVFVQYGHLGYCPFDVAVQMRGMDSIMYDVIDCPDKVHAMMEFLTAAHVQHHLNREKRGWINIFPSDDGRYTAFGWRVHSAYLADDFHSRMPALRDEWAYVSAQTSSGLGPDMYAQFVQPYNQRLASLFCNKTVYYHGCECLDQKLDVLAGLANLRRFHVSPWSSVPAAAAKFAGKAVLEVHSHPGRVFFGQTQAQMKADLQELIRQASTAQLDLNLSDIHNVNNQPHVLTAWAQAAQEVSGNINP